jgi:Tol biopolymer transport system component
MDLARGLGSRLTRNSADDMNPLWTPDGRWILFSSTRNGLTICTGVGGRKR